MKAAVFYEPGVVKVEEKADPVIHGDEVLIRVMSAGRVRFRKPRA